MEQPVQRISNRNRIVTITRVEVPQPYQPGYIEIRDLDLNDAAAELSPSTMSPHPLGRRRSRLWRGSLGRLFRHRRGVGDCRHFIAAVHIHSGSRGAASPGRTQYHARPAALCAHSASTCSQVSDHQPKPTAATRMLLRSPSSPRRGRTPAAMSAAQRQGSGRASATLCHDANSLKVKCPRVSPTRCLLLDRSAPQRPPVSLSWAVAGGEGGGGMRGAGNPVRAVIVPPVHPEISAGISTGLFLNRPALAPVVAGCKLSARRDCNGRTETFLGRFKDSRAHDAS